MFGGLALLLAVVILAVAPTLGVVQWVEHHYRPSLGWVALQGVAGVIAVGLPLLVGRIAVRRGARHLEQHGINA